MRKIILTLLITSVSFSLFSQQWQQIDGINSIPVRNLAILNDRIFVNYQYGDIFYSDNNGLDWINTNVPYPAARIVVFKSKVYIQGLYVGLCVSDDLGMSWNPVADTLVHAFNMCASEDYMYISNSSGLYRSDNGQDWTFVKSGQDFGNSSSMGTYKDQIWVHTNSVQYSNDKGLTWSILSSPYATRGACMNDTLLFVWDYSGIYYCETVNHWISINKNLPSDISISNVESNDLGLFMSSNKGVFYLSDINSSWINLDNGANFSKQGKFAINGNKILFGLNSSTGIYYRSDLWSNWESRNNGLNFSNVESFFKHNDLYAAIVDNKLFISKNSGINWSHYYIENLSTPNIYDPSFAYFNDELIISTNAGLIRYSLIDGTLNIGNTSPFYWNLEVSNNLLYGSTNNGLCYTDDISKPWTYFNNSLVLCPIKNFIVKNSKIYTSSQSHGVIFSDDAGNTWEHISQGLDYYYDSYMNDTLYPIVEDFIITDSSTTILFDYNTYDAAHDDYATYDFVNSIWEYYDLNIPTSIIDHSQEFYDLYLKDNVFYLAAKSGLYSSNINSNNWININEDIDQFYYFDKSKKAKKIYHYNDYLFVSIENASMWTTYSPNQVPNLNYSLDLLVYPNPTSGKITIESGRIKRVEVLDLQGKLIYSGKQTEVNLGSQENGIYIIKISTEKGVVVKRIIKE